MSDSQCIRGGRFKRFKVEGGCLGGNGFLEEMVFSAGPRIWVALYSLVGVP